MLQSIAIPSASGRQIPALHCDNGDSLTILVHGIMSEKTEGGFYTSLAERLLRQGESVLTIDLAGHGASEVQFQDTSITKMVEDLIAVSVYSNERYRAINLVCASFGASIYLLSQDFHGEKLKRVVLLNPVTNYRVNFCEADTEWGRHFSPQLHDAGYWSKSSHNIPGRDMALGRLFISELALLSPQAVKLDELREFLVIHGTADQVISIESVKAFLSTQSTQVYRFEALPGAGHGFDGKEEEVFSSVCKFLGSVR